MDVGITVVGLGEALWDVLPGGKVLGGAPLNVAYHVQQLFGAAATTKGLAGASPTRGRGVVASRVGTDELGDEVIRELGRRGMSTDYVERDAIHPTSTVNVTLAAGQPTFTFTPDIAWDHLEFTPAWAELAGGCAAVCYGTLAQRSAKSRATIAKFLDAAGHAVRLFDVNLRQGFYDRESIAESCRRATIVKLNDKELPVVAEAVGVPSGTSGERLSRLRSQFELDAVVFTRGERGTMLVLPDAVIDPPAASYPQQPDADCVGAGDASSAGMLAGWLLGLPPAKTVELANHLGAYVASQSGATPVLPVEIIGRIG